MVGALFELHWESCTSWTSRLLFLLYYLLQETSPDLSTSEDKCNTTMAADKKSLARGGDITWGEFLLLLSLSQKDDLSKNALVSLITVVRKREGLFFSLNRSEELALQRKCILNDHEWAMVPLMIPVEELKSAHSKNQLLPSPWLTNTGMPFCRYFRLLRVKHFSTGTSVESVGRLKQEALRLSRERAYLLSR